MLLLSNKSREELILLQRAFGLALSTSTLANRWRPAAAVLYAIAVGPSLFGFALLAL
jgi:hypothetical protein